MGRLALILLDAAERSFMQELVAHGELPTIGALLDRGTFAPVRSPMPYRAEYARTELLTGKPAETSRYWGTILFDPATYRCGTIGSAQRRPFYADPPTGQVVAFDISHSVLVPGLHGEQVVGWGGHDARFQHPRVSLPDDLMAEIDARFGIDPTASVEYRGTWHQEGYINDLADALVAAARRRADIAIWLLARSPEWSLFFMALSEVHSAGHNFAQGVDAGHLLGSHPTAALARARLIEVYRAADDTIGRIQAALPPDAVLAVTTPIGMAPNRDEVASSLLLPELLYRLAFGRALVHEPTHRAWRRRGFPSVRPDPGRRASHRIALLRAEGTLAPVKRRFHTLAPQPVLDAMHGLRRWRSGPSGPAPVFPGPDDLLPDGSRPTLRGSADWQPAMRYQSWWPRMPWFALPTFSDGHIRLNVTGRELQGQIPLDAYDRACDELENRLRRATDPRTGQPLVDEVFRLRADDPMAPDGPGADLVITWAAPAEAIEHPEAGVIGPFAFPRSGSHTPNGFLLAAGPGIPNQTLTEHPAADLSPTLLALLGWPSRDDLPGSAIPTLAAAGSPSS